MQEEKKWGEVNNEELQSWGKTGEEQFENLKKAA